MGEEGPAHLPTFTSVVFVDGARMGRGTGSSKKESESAAALDALRNLGDEETIKRVGAADAADAAGAADATLAAGGLS